MIAMMSSSKLFFFYLVAACCAQEGTEQLYGEGKKKVQQRSWTCSEN